MVHVVYVFKFDYLIFSLFLYILLIFDFINWFPRWNSQVQASKWTHDDQFFIVLLCWLSPVMLVFSCNVAVGFTCMLVRFVGLINKVLENIYFREK